MTNFGVKNVVRELRQSGNRCAVFISFENLFKKDYCARNWRANHVRIIPVLGHALDRVPITYQIGSMQLRSSPPCWMISTKRVVISFVFIIQHARHSPCYLNPWGMAANQLQERRIQSRSIVCRYDFVNNYVEKKKEKKKQRKLA